MAERNNVKVPIWAARLFIVIFMIPILCISALQRLFRELRSIPQYIWWDWCEDVSSAGHIWRTGEIQGEEEW